MLLKKVFSLRFIFITLISALLGVIAGFILYESIVAMIEARSFSYTNLINENNLFSLILVALTTVGIQIIIRHCGHNYRATLIQSNIALI
jgi:hypothetical protein